MKFNKQKFLRYLKIEHQCRIALLFIILTGLVLKLESDILKNKQQALGSVRDQKELVLQIPSMERRIKLHKEQIEALRLAQEEARKQQEKELQDQMAESAKAEPVTGKEHLVPSLGGIGVVPDASAAIIDGEVYTQGQTCGNYTVKEIALDYVILENNLNQEELKLQIEDPALKLNYELHLP